MSAADALNLPLDEVIKRKTLIKFKAGSAPAGSMPGPAKGTGDVSERLNKSLDDIIKPKRPANQQQQQPFKQHPVKQYPAAGFSVKQYPAAARPSFPAKQYPATARPGFPVKQYPAAARPGFPAAHHKFDSGQSQATFKPFKKQDATAQPSDLLSKDAKLSMSLDDVMKKNKAKVAPIHPAKATVCMCVCVCVFSQ